MPGDLAIQSASLTSAASPTAQTPVDPGSAAAIQSRTPAAASATSAAGRSGETAAASSAASSQSLHTNPVSHLDPALGIVVLGFYNGQGVETSSIPTQKQLNSYRLHGTTTDSVSKPESGSET